MSYLLHPPVLAPSNSLSLLSNPKGTTLSTSPRPSPHPSLPSNSPPNSSTTTAAAVCALSTAPSNPVTPAPHSSPSSPPSPPPSAISITSGYATCGATPPGRVFYGISGPRRTSRTGDLWSAERIFAPSGTRGGGSRESMCFSRRPMLPPPCRMGR